MGLCFYSSSRYKANRKNSRKRSEKSSSKSKRRSQSPAKKKPKKRYHDIQEYRDDQNIFMPKSRYRDDVKYDHEAVSIKTEILV